MANNIAIAMITGKRNDSRDKDLWEKFQDDFTGYTEHKFEIVNNNNIRRLCKFFKKQQIWIEKSRTTIARLFFNSLQKKKLIE